MKIANIARPFSAGAITFTAATATTSVAAMAACGGAPTLVALSGLVGPPSISATETSTDQALELIRKRREEASGSCPSGFTRSGGNCVPVGAAADPAPQVAAAAPAPAPAASVTTTTTTGPAVAPQPQAKRAQVSRPAQSAGSQTAAAQSTAPSTRAASAGYAGNSYDLSMPGTTNVTGAWFESYYDYEKHSNLNPGQQANPSRRTVSGGVVSGADVSQYQLTNSGVVGHQLGFFGGYNATRAKFSETLDPVEGTNDAIATLNNRQEVFGGFFGFYGAAIRGAWSADLAVKLDLFSVEQSFTERNINECGGGTTVTDIPRFRETSLTNYTVASNLNYRMPMGGTMYFEPTVGMRYTYSDFGGNARTLGLRDGEVFRIQGGARIGMQHTTPDGWIWQSSLTGLLYSDVAMNGLVVTGPQGPGLSVVSTPVDEGKLRAMAILETRVNVGYGYSFYGDLNVRGGEDVIGYGGRIGVRYQW